MNRGHSVSRTLSPARVGERAWGMKIPWILFWSLASLCRIADKQCISLEDQSRYATWIYEVIMIFRRFRESHHDAFLQVQYNNNYFYGTKYPSLKSNHRFVFAMCACTKGTSRHGRGFLAPLWDHILTAIGNGWLSEARRGAAHYLESIQSHPPPPPPHCVR